MKRSVLGGAALTFVACSAGRPPAPLFDSRVPLAPLVEKLQASGGDRARILQPASAADLSRLEPGKRYRFVVRSDGRLAVAPLPVDAPSNEYVHPVLGEGGPVRTAGGIRVDRKGETIDKVTVDQDSKAYCPTADSLSAALTELSRLGVPAERLRVENRPPVCVGAPPPPEPPARYGALMSEVGARFERMARAASAGRRELASFELGEIEEIFEEDLPRAEAPRESQGVDLNGVADAFRRTNLPDLKSALEAKDPAAFPAAYARAAETCNGCHRVSGHVFVEIPLRPGDPIPRLDRQGPPRLSGRRRRPGAGRCQRAPGRRWTDGSRS